MRGDTSDRVAGAELTAPATRALVARAEQAATLVDVQRLVAELRALTGVREAALATTTPDTGAYLFELPVGPAQWRLALRVRTHDQAAYQVARPAAQEIAAAAERAIARACTALPAERTLVLEPLYRSLVRAARSVIVVIDPAAGWTALSEAFDLVLGYDRQAPGEAGLLDLVHPDDRAAAVGSFVDACAGRDPGGPLELRIRSVAGRWRTLEVVVRTFVHDPRVRAVAYLGIDVTGQRAALRELRDELTRLRAALDGGLGAGFIPTVAHELRGPLSSVVAFAHLLGDPSSGPLSEDQSSYLDVIDRNANRLLRLIEELLLLSRLGTGKLPLRPAAVRVPALVEAVLAERAADAHEAGVTLTCELVDGPELVCDEARIHQVLDSLLANALKFTTAGGRVVVGAQPTGSGWLLAVSDTGIGIPEREQPRLFSPFFRASNAATAGARAGRPGAGLGLVIARAIVELHGGAIEVASTEGVGTTVTVTLPPRPDTLDGG